MRCLNEDVKKPISGFDGALKDLFERDRPRFLERIAGGVSVKAFLNPDLPKLQERRADMVMRLADGSILHVEFQSSNHPRMAYRMAMYHLLLFERYKRLMRHVVLYVGAWRMSMPPRFDSGPMQFACTMTDIREVKAQTLLRTGEPADFALAILAGGGRERIKQIVARLARLRGPARDRAIAQLIVLSGLRANPREVLREVEHMGVVIDYRKNPVLMQWWREGVEEGREEGHEEGMRLLLQQTIEAKFGRLPKRAQDRVRKASADELGKWAKKVVAARTLDEVFARQRTPRKP